IRIFRILLLFRIFIESKKKKKRVMMFIPLDEMDLEDLEFLERLERELTPWEHKYLEELHERRDHEEKLERQAKVMEGFADEEPILVLDLPGYVEDEVTEFMVERIGCEDSPSFGVVSMDVGQPDDTRIDVEEAEVAEILDVAREKELHTMFEGAEAVKVKEEILVVVDEGYDDTYKKDHADTKEATFQQVVIEIEEVPEVWMVEDESLRTRTFSKGAGMIRKWVLTPDDKKDQEPRLPEKAEERAKTTHAWPKRRVRARMRGAQVHKKGRIQEGRAHAHWRRRAWRLMVWRSGAQRVDVGWLMRARGYREWTSVAKGRISKWRASGHDARKTATSDGALWPSDRARAAEGCAVSKKATGVDWDALAFGELDGRKVRTDYGRTHARDRDAPVAGVRDSAFAVDVLSPAGIGVLGAGVHVHKELQTLFQLEIVTRPITSSEGYTVQISQQSDEYTNLDDFSKFQQHYTIQKCTTIKSINNF
ncbi:Unknown protein, partial [Striga hermonthica]